MKHRFLLALAFAAAAVHAQTVPDEAAERDRLARERQVAEAKYKEAQKSCRAKFAVTDCLDKARREYQQVVGGIKRQEHVLNDVERKRRAAEAQRQIDEKNSPEAQQAAAEKRARALSEQQQREAQAAEKAARRAADEAKKEQRGPREKAPHGASGPQGSAREPALPKAHGPSAEEQAKNRAEYEQRIAEAEKHKAEIAARNAARTKAPSADLPPPPNH
jgi:hypothetical protein